MVLVLSVLLLVQYINLVQIKRKKHWMQWGYKTN